jgi:addiction module HigA family antidote
MKRSASTAWRQAIRVPANRISLIVNEKRRITADTAARLGRYFGTAAQYWLNIQNRFGSMPMNRPR